MGRLWGPAVCVTWYRIEMGVWVHWKPGACVVVTLGSRVCEDFIDGAGWVLLECWGQVPELAWVNVTVRDGLRGPLEDWLELCSEGSGEVVRCHPLLSSM